MGCDTSVLAARSQQFEFCEANDFSSSGCARAFAPWHQPFFEAPPFLGALL